MIGKLNLEPLNIRHTNKRLTLFHKVITGHLALPIGNLQPVLRHTRLLNSKAYNTIHTSKDCYSIGLQLCFLPRDNERLEFTTRQNSHYPRTTEIQHISCALGLLVWLLGSVGQYFKKTSCCFAYSLVAMHFLVTGTDLPTVPLFAGKSRFFTRNVPLKTFSRLVSLRVITKILA